MWRHLRDHPPHICGIFLKEGAMRNEVKMTLGGPLMFVKGFNGAFNISELQCNIRMAGGTFLEIFLRSFLLFSPDYNATLGWQMGPLEKFYLAFHSCPGDSWLAIACTIRYCGPLLKQEVSRIHLVCHRSLLLSLFQPSGSEKLLLSFALRELSRYITSPAWKQRSKFVF